MLTSIAPPPLVVVLLYARVAHVMQSSCCQCVNEPSVASHVQCTVSKLAGRKLGRRREAHTHVVVLSLRNQLTSRLGKDHVLSLLLVSLQWSSYMTLDHQSTANSIISCKTERNGQTNVIQGVV